MKVRFRFLQQCQQMRRFLPICAQPELGKGLKDQQGRQASTAEPVKSQRQSRLTVLVQHDFGCSRQFFESQRHRLQLDRAYAGLSIGQTGKV